MGEEGISLVKVLHRLKKMINWNCWLINQGHVTWFGIGFKFRMNIGETDNYFNNRSVYRYEGSVTWTSIIIKYE